jgi:hypothetical protein
LDRNKIESNGWRQGAVIHIKQLRKAVPLPDVDFGDDDLAILVSHDCDIIHHDAANEPVVEWLHVRPINKTDGRLLHGKNPRRLHFEYNGKSYETRAYMRLITPRPALLEFSVGSVPALPKKLTSQIANWIGKRYSRAAFPDEFNKRVGTKRAAIANAVDKDHEFLRAILIRVEPQTAELPANQAYEVLLTGIMAQADYDNPVKREPCQAVISELESLLSDCDGIDVEDCRLCPDTKISLADLDYLVEWDFDYLSIADGGG